MRTQFVVMIVGLLVCGCSPDPVQKDLTNYVVNELPRLVRLENMAVDSYDRVTGANYTDDLSLYHALLNTVIPSYKEFINRVEGIHPETKEVRALHETIIEAANTQMSAFTLMVGALENRDFRTLNDANERLDKGRRLVRKWTDGMKQLASEHGVKVDESLFQDRAAAMNRDAVQNDLSNLGARAQQYYRRPPDLGGGGKSFEGITIDKLTTKPENLNGLYSVRGSTSVSVTLVGMGVQKGKDGQHPIQVTATVFPDTVLFVTDN